MPLCRPMQPPGSEVLEVLQGQVQAVCSRQDLYAACRCAVVCRMQPGSEVLQPSSAGRAAARTSICLPLCRCAVVCVAARVDVLEVLQPPGPLYAAFALRSRQCMQPQSLYAAASVHAPPRLLCRHAHLCSRHVGLQASVLGRRVRSMYGLPCRSSCVWLRMWLHGLLHNTVYGRVPCLMHLIACATTDSHPL